MVLKVIGTGLGRTGTLSLKQALEQLGFGPCYHMLEVFPRPEHAGIWTRAARGEKVDWDALFEGFCATVDWPSVRFWRELIAHYPDAKVIHGARDAESWYKSFSQTIAPALERDAPDSIKPWSDMVRLAITEQTFGGDLGRENAIRVYHRHNEEVAREIPVSRRLDYDAAGGWEPLCRFLNVEIPDTPFPKTNSTDEFQARSNARK
ncbi:MAG: sulfotransferase family protein [Alphaproteobacteria bacterium]|nr:sulfotransferase family protein [Alphaproteobacteria bacterium]